jgi:hypothetical protein
LKREKEGQQDSLMVKGVQLYRWAGRSNQSANGQPEGQPIEGEECSKQDDTPKEKHGGGGSIHD